jgi:hypothetical protein
MKKVIIALIILCFSMNVVASTATWGNVHHGQKTKKISKTKVIVGGAVLAGVALYAINHSKVNKYVASVFAKDIRYEEKKRLIRDKYWDLIYDEKYSYEKRLKTRTEVQASLRYYMLRYPTSIGLLSYDVANELKIFTVEYETQMKKDIAEGHSIMVVLTSIVNDIQKNNKHKCDYVETRAIYNYMPSEYVPSIGVKGVPEVAEFDVGPYKDLQAVSGKTGVGDGLDLDHIPAKAAVYRFLEKRDFRKAKSPSEVNYIKANTTAMAILYKTHKDGRTNADKAKKLMEEDSENLLLATALDFELHIINETKERGDKNYLALINAFKKVIERNTRLCLYEGATL